MKNILIRKYVFFSFIGVMLFFNFIILMKGIYHIIPNTRMLGEDSNTLGFYSFWADILSSIASFTMIFITAKTLEQNKQQLNEMKRQWYEEHRPYVACELSPSDKTCCLRLHIINYSNVIADNIKINIINNLDYSDSLNNDCTLLNKSHHDAIFDYICGQSFTLAPQGNIYINLDIPGGDLEPFPDLVTLDGFLDVTIETPKSSVRNFKLYPSNFQFFSE